MKLPNRMSAQSVQLTLAATAVVGCGLGVLFGVLGWYWAVFAVAPVAFGAMVLMFLNRCPRCRHPLWKKSGEWPFEQPKNLWDHACASCGLDLRTPPHKIFEQ